jgi:HK97 family phage major capsid protein
MPYNSQLSETNVSSLIPLDVSREILLAVPQMNPILRMARRLPNMSEAQRRMPVMSALATAYFVSGRTGLKQTTEVSWDDKYIDAEELAVIVPIPQSVLDDVNYDIWGNVKPELERAISVAVTNAVLFGTNIPTTWTTNLGAAGLITLAGHVHISAYTDLYEAILGETDAGTLGLFGCVEEDGYMVTGSIAHLSMRSKLRNCRDADGNPIFKSSIQRPGAYELDGSPIEFPTDGTMTAANGLLISGQWDQLVYAMRQDISYTIADQGVIQDATGAIVYNLFQQDMVALRAVIRLGFALPNPINRVQETEASRCPFKVLLA